MYERQRLDRRQRPSGLEPSAFNRQRRPDAELWINPQTVRGSDPERDGSELALATGDKWEWPRCGGYGRSRVSGRVS